MLDALRHGTLLEWEEAEQPVSEDEQVRIYAKLMRTFQWFADYGEGDRPRSMNALRAGLFEFKAGKGRISFYDTVYGLAETG